MNAYSEDLKKKIVGALGRGATKTEAARSFGVSRSSVKLYAKLSDEDRSDGRMRGRVPAAYSPDLNTIEQAFSKVKGLPRRAESRTREALIEAMGQALNAVPVRDVRGFFGHCGYRTVDQPL